jgi:hypothetical protein
MDLYLDRLLNLPNTTVESFTEEENKITLKLRFLQDEITVRIVIRMVEN